MINLMPVINFICMVGTLFCVYQAVKNRNTLKGISIVGSGLTFAAMFLLLVYLLNLWDWISALFAIPTVVYWFLLLCYSINIKLKGVE